MNAFLSACRSVTFLLQGKMSGAPGFKAWYEQRQEALQSDNSAKFVEGSYGTFLKRKIVCQRWGLRSAAIVGRGD
jgi:hypothetical protein